MCHIYILLPTKSLFQSQRRNIESYFEAKYCFFYLQINFHFYFIVVEIFQGKVSSMF